MKYRVSILGSSEDEAEPFDVHGFDPRQHSRNDLQSWMGYEYQTSVHEPSSF